MKNINFKQLFTNKNMIIAGAAVLLVVTSVAISYFMFGNRINNKVDFRNNQNRGFGMMMDENSKRIYGKVTKVEGNEVTIALAEERVPKKTNDANAQATDPNAVKGAPTDATAKTDNTVKSNATTDGNQPNFEGGGNFQNGDRPQGGQMGNWSGNGDKSQRMMPKTAADLKLTGETVKVTIPVGLEITKMGTGMGNSQNSNGQNTVQIADIEADTIITVIVDKNDANEVKTATRVMVR